MARTVSIVDTANRMAVPKRVSAAALARDNGRSKRKYGKLVIRQHSCRRASAMRDQALQEAGKLRGWTMPRANSALVVVNAQRLTGARYRATSKINHRSARPPLADPPGTDLAQWFLRRILCTENYRLEHYRQRDLRDVPSSV